METIIASREKDLAGFRVLRVLPFATHRMVGPFIFFDHIGPASFLAGQGIDVKPHPHINLCTVTYLFEGKLLHQDSLGSQQIIKPGDINLMFAGRGIVHSERTPIDSRKSSNTLHGVQCWIALPQQYEELPANFSHYAKSEFTEIEINNVKIKILLGNAFGYQSSVQVYSDLLYCEINMQKGAKLILPHDEREIAAYIVTGSVLINESVIQAHNMVIFKDNDNTEILALAKTHIMLLGGQSLGTRYIYWNFVSSRKERIEQAKTEWAQGPGNETSHFPCIPNDNKEFIPLPFDSSQNPSGTII
jgi:redox-sensitive bicupin YhaK (pirin superfamily)